MKYIAIVFSFLIGLFGSTAQAGDIVRQPDDTQWVRNTSAAGSTPDSSGNPMPNVLKSVCFVPVDGSKSDYAMCADSVTELEELEYDLSTVPTPCGNDQLYRARTVADTFDGTPVVSAFSADRMVVQLDACLPVPPGPPTLLTSPPG
jgi:hypothetical protein